MSSRSILRAGVVFAIFLILYCINTHEEQIRAEQDAGVLPVRLQPPYFSLTHDKQRRLFARLASSERHALIAIAVRKYGARYLQNLDYEHQIERAPWQSVVSEVLRFYVHEDIELGFCEAKGASVRIGGILKSDELKARLHAILEKYNDRQFTIINETVVIKKGGDNGSVDR
jgi:hypothetical protein